MMEIPFLMPLSAIYSTPLPINFDLHLQSFILVLEAIKLGTRHHSVFDTSYGHQDPPTQPHAYRLYHSVSPVFRISSAHV